MTEDVGGSPRDRLAALLAGRSPSPGDRAAARIPRRADPDAAVPLTPIQRRLFFLWQLEPDRPAYHLPLVLRLRGAVDADALSAAVRDLVERHEVLRSVVATTDGEPVARVLPASTVPIETAEPGHGAALDELLAAHARRPFALEGAPPCRVLLVRVAEDDYALALTLHHIASDGRSQELLLADLADLYAAHLGLRPAPAPPARQYGDVARWRHDHRDGTAESEQLEWWADRLAGLPPVLELPADRPRPADPDWSSDLVPVVLPDALVTAVRETATGTGTSPFMVLLAGLQALLSRLARTDDLTVGMPETGRHHPDTEDVVGCLLNTLVVRGDLSGDPTGRELLHRVRAQVLGALSHADVPFERIVQRVRPDRSLGATPLYQVQLNVFDQPAPPRFPGVRAEVSYTRVGTAKFDLAFELADGGPDGGLAGDLEYRRELFDPATAARIPDWYLRLLAGMLSDLDRPVGAVPLEPVAGPLLSGPARDAPVAATLVERFRRSVERRPDAVAVVGPDGQATYAELERRANRIAHRLVAAGVAPDTPVGVLLEPGVDLAAAILGVLSAGAGYLPVDPTYPPQRVAQMLDIAGVAAMVTTADLGLLPTGRRQRVPVWQVGAGELHRSPRVA